MAPAGQQRKVNARPSGRASRAKPVSSAPEPTTAQLCTTPWQSPRDLNSYSVGRVGDIYRLPFGPTSTAPGLFSQVLFATTPGHRVQQPGRGELVYLIAPRDEQVPGSIDGLALRPVQQRLGARRA